ncbi:hypothetical protein LHFGNBLO_005963 (plasmid) [Mesorhizobium sp. AR10]|nr:hypothetical protein LHFGNBLO_005963 [Mesorhizobium sp. AR10]
MMDQFLNVNALAVIYGPQHDMESLLLEVATDLVRAGVQSAGPGNRMSRRLRQGRGTCWLPTV